MRRFLLLFFIDSLWRTMCVLNLSNLFLHPAQQALGVLTLHLCSPDLSQRPRSLSFGTWGTVLSSALSPLSSQPADSHHISCLNAGLPLQCSGTPKLCWGTALWNAVREWDYHDARPVLPAVHCLRAGASSILSNYKVLYGRRASLVPILAWRLGHGRTVIFFSQLVCLWNSSFWSMGEFLAGLVNLKKNHTLSADNEILFSDF